MDWLKKKVRLLPALLAGILLMAPGAAQAQDAVQVAGVDGFQGGCDPAINVAGFTVIFNVAGTVTVRGQAYTEFHDVTVTFGATTGGGQVVQFVMNAPRLPENTVVQYTISNGDPATAVYVAVNCTTGAVYRQRLLGSDGRLFAGDDLPVVIYPRLDRSGSPIFDFYTINPATGRGRLALRVTNAMLTAVPANPRANTLIATVPGGLAALYRLTSGEFQVNFAPDFEGKVRVVVFDAHSPSRIRRADYGGS